jgi:hypothetical protein
MWTEHVADDGRRLVDPLVAQLLPANTPPDWIQRGLWREWDGLANAVRGEIQRQDIICGLPGVTTGLVDDMRCEPVEVEFVREHDNPYDRFACRAMVAGQQVGYLSRECATVLGPQVDAAGVAAWRVAGAVVGGSRGAEYLGVHVWLDRRLSAGPAWPPSD